MFLASRVHCPAARGVCARGDAAGLRARRARAARAIPRDRLVRCPRRVLARLAVARASPPPTTPRPSSTAEERARGRRRRARTPRVGDAPDPGAARDLASALGLDRVASVRVPVPVTFVFVGFDGDGQLGLHLEPDELERWFHHLDHVAPHVRVPPSSARGFRGSSAPDESPLVSLARHDFTCRVARAGPRALDAFERFLEIRARPVDPTTASSSTGRRPPRAGELGEPRDPKPPAADARVEYHVDAAAMAEFVDSFVDALGLADEYALVVLNPRKNVLDGRYGYRHGFAEGEIAELRPRRAELVREARRRRGTANEWAEDPDRGRFFSRLKTEKKSSRDSSRASTGYARFFGGGEFANSARGGKNIKFTSATLDVADAADAWAARATAHLERVRALASSRAPVPQRGRDAAGASSSSSSAERFAAAKLSAALEDRGRAAGRAARRARGGGDRERERAAGFEVRVRRIRGVRGSGGPDSEEVRFEYLEDCPTTGGGGALVWTSARGPPRGASARSRGGAGTPGTSPTWTFGSDTWTPGRRCPTRADARLEPQLSAAPTRFERLGVDPRAGVYARSWCTRPSRGNTASAARSVKLCETLRARVETLASAAARVPTKLPSIRRVAARRGVHLRRRRRRSTPRSRATCSCPSSGGC